MNTCTHTHLSDSTKLAAPLTLCTSLPPEGAKVPESEYQHITTLMEASPQDQHYTLYMGGNGVVKDMGGNGVVKDMGGDGMVKDMSGDR